MPRLFVGAVTLLIGLSAADAFAGRIFGDIRLDGKPLPAGVMVTVAVVTPTANSPADSTKTDQFGSYKLNVKEDGKCFLTLVHEGQTAALVVFSYQNPTRYDLVLEKKDGKLVLRRR
jgi:hypothetical protein